MSVDSGGSRIRIFEFIRLPPFMKFFWLDRYKCTGVGWMAREVQFVGHLSR